MKKNQLTPEEKAKVWAMYWDAPYIHDGTTVEPKTIFTVKGSVLDNILRQDVVDRKLLLSSFANITDEHVIEVAMLCVSDAIYKNKKDWTIHRGSINRGNNNLILVHHQREVSVIIHTDKNFVEPIWTASFKPIATVSDNLYQADAYLKSKHYAVRLWFGIDHWANGKTAIELELANEKIK